MKRSGFFIVTIMSLSLMFPLGRPTAISHASFSRPFDEYRNICWEDEKARLDSFAVALQNDPTTLGHIVVYDGKVVCRGETVARAIRAKKYLVEYRGVEADRIVWRWGGYLGDMTTQLVLHPRGASIWAFRESIPLAEVTFAGNCYRKVRPVTCIKWDAPKRLQRTRRE